MTGASRQDRPAALVTGGRRGVGRATALALAERGFDVVINDIVEDEAATKTLAELRERTGAAFVQGDVAAVGGHASLLDAAWNTFGRLDCLVNNAGISQPRLDLLDHAVDSYDNVMDVNLRGPFFLTLEWARRVTTSANAGDLHRSVVFISSCNAEMVSEDRAAYCMSKAGVSMAAKLFSVRLAKEGIAVYEVRPGVIETDMTAVVKDRYERMIADGKWPMRRWGQPLDVGRAVAAMAAGEFSFVTGAVLDVDGGLHMNRL